MPLIKPTKDRIFFSEYDVMKSVAASLEVAYSNRIMHATTNAERQWWEAKELALHDFVRAAVDTDPEDLVRRSRLMRDEFKRIGGITPTPRDEER